MTLTEGVIPAPVKVCELLNENVAVAIFVREASLIVNSFVTLPAKSFIPVTVTVPMPASVFSP